MARPDVCPTCGNPPSDPARYEPHEREPEAGVMRCSDACHYPTPDTPPEQGQEEEWPSGFATLPPDGQREDVEGAADLDAARGDGEWWPHKVKLVIEDGRLTVEPVCGDGCPADCEAFVEAWLDEGMPDEVLHGRVEFDAAITARPCQPDDFRGFDLVLSSERQRAEQAEAEVERVREQQRAERMERESRLRAALGAIATANTHHDAAYLREQARAALDETASTPERADG